MATAKKTEETENTTTAAPSVDEMLKRLEKKSREELDNTIKAAKQVRRNNMTFWEKRGDDVLTYGPYVLTAAAAGAGGYYLAGGFSSDAGVEGVEGADLHVVNG